MSEQIMNCQHCNLPYEKTSEIPLANMLLCQLTKYNYLSELVEIEKKSHCSEQFAYLLKNSKKPIDGTKRGPFQEIKNLLGLK